MVIYNYLKYNQVKRITDVPGTYRQKLYDGIPEYAQKALPRSGVRALFRSEIMRH
ncbi:hypothetical protein [Morganella morganii IS15]|nr:hypothetical protein CSB69_3475 [Morganella morganii]EMP52728.1 hypothetical protein C790_03701 [Morganella morganii SC01]CDK67873.1 hypothetical protein [Morganella morganii IS15]